MTLLDVWRWTRSLNPICSNLIVLFELERSTSSWDSFQQYLSFCFEFTNETKQNQKFAVENSIKTNSSIFPEEDCLVRNGFRLFCLDWRLNWAFACYPNGTSVPIEANRFDNHLKSINDLLIGEDRIWIYRCNEWHRWVSLWAERNWFDQLANRVTRRHRFPQELNGLRIEYPHRIIRARQEKKTFVLFINKINSIYWENVNAWADIDAVFSVGLDFELFDDLFFGVSVTNGLFFCWWTLNTTSHTNSAKDFCFFL